MKSIDAKKRHAEYDLSPLSEASTVTTTTAAPVHTTVKYIPKAQDDSVVVDSIVDSTSEKKQVLVLNKTQKKRCSIFSENRIILTERTNKQNKIRLKRCVKIPFSFLDIKN